MNHFFGLVFAALLAGTCVTRGATPSRPALKAQRLERSRQLARSVDLGDSYRTPDGRRQLRRLLGEVAVRLEVGAVEEGLVEELTGADGPLAGYSAVRRHQSSLVVFQLPNREALRQRSDPAAPTRALSATRSARGVRWAGPVFVDPDSGLWLIPTGNLVLRLNPEVDPAEYFGSSDLPRLRAWPGSRDHFTLARPEDTAPELFAEVDRRMNDPRVRWVEPEFLCQVMKYFTPNDPLYGSQWHLDNPGADGVNPDADVKASEAWDITHGNPDIVIAIMDDGLQATHPDLAPNIFTNRLESANSRDDDANGYLDDLRGWDFFDGDNNPDPSHPEDNHGTATAGVAAARGNNSTGVTGIAYGCSILPLKVIEGPDIATSSGLSQAIRYAAGLNAAGTSNWRGADVISISLGFPGSAAINDALTDAATSGRNGRGCAIFAATGNEAAGWVPAGLYGINAGFRNFRWEYVKDESEQDGADTAWLDSVTFPDGTTERFEGGSLPAGWSTSGNAAWYAVQDGVNGNHAVTGWDGPGSGALRAGRVFDNQTSRLQVSRQVPYGDLSYWVWISSEVDFDFLDVYVDNVLQDSFSGVPLVSTSSAYPANHPNVLGVGASTDFDFRADYSQYGTELEFVAPSSGGFADILITDRTGGNGYATTPGAAGDYTWSFGGTSAACPLAAGIAALMLSVNPELSSVEIRDLMRQSCDQVGGVAYVNGRDPHYGSGRLNAGQAVKLAQVDLGLTQAVWPETAPAETDFTFTLVVTNRNAATAHAVRVSDTLPANLALVAAGSTLGTVTNTGPAISVQLGDLPAGMSATITIVARALTPGPITNSATVTASVPDAVPADNSATVTAFATATQPPLLSVNQTGNQLVFTWPATAQGYRLEYTASLAPPALWTLSPEIPQLAGNVFTVTESAPASLRFYRLKR